MRAEGRSLQPSATSQCCIGELWGRDVAMTDIPTTKSELLSVLQQLGVHPSRRLGQNFLVDHNLLLALVRDASPQAGERVLEVGPGLGVLTSQLLAAGAEVTAVEIDHRLAQWLREHFGEHGCFHLLEGDACKLDYDLVMGREPYRCIANLPYAASSVLICRLLDQARPPTAMFLLLQREMAERLAGAPRTKQYGALSVQVQLLYEVRILRRIPPNVFFPPPEVESVYVSLTLRPDLAPAERLLRARHLARTGFAQRRKRLLKVLGPELAADLAGPVLAELGFSADARAEELPPSAYLELAAAERRRL